MLATLQRAVGGGRLRRVVLEELPMASQMALVSEASGIIGVHGQAFAWLPFLPWPTRPVGVVEISIATRRGWFNACYERWAEALGVRYWRVAGALTGGCSGGATSRDDEATRAHKMLSCNVTVDVSLLVGAVYRVHELTQSQSGQTQSRRDKEL